MFAHLLLQQRIMYHINEVIESIDTRVDALESLDLVSDCHGIGMCSGRLSVRRVGRPTSCGVHSRPVSLLLQGTTSLFQEPPTSRPRYVYLYWPDNSTLYSRLEQRTVI